MQLKSYTDLGQSKKLAEILPLKSADMCYIKDKPNIGFLQEEYKEFGDTILQDYYPCWSLAALLNILPDEADIVKGKVDVGDYKYMCTVCIKEEVITAFGNNLVDTCVDIIIKLYKRKLL